MKYEHKAAGPSDILIRRYQGKAMNGKWPRGVEQSRIRRHRSACCRPEFSAQSAQYRASGVTLYYLPHEQK